MSIIGNPLVTTNYISDSFSGNASTVAFTLSQAPASDASIAVYISGLYQIPTSAYSISGTTLTFTGAPPTGTNNITVLHLGVKSATLVPVNGSVTPPMLSTANVIYWSASNNNVGIGNVTPTSLLTVTGTAALGNTTFAGTISANGGVGTAGQVLTSGATGNAYWSTVAGFSNGQSISVSALEAVGNNIATAAGDTANILIRTNDTTAVNKGGMIGFAGVSDSGNLMFASVKGAKESTDAGYLAFSTRTASAYATERMRISSNGDVRFISTSSYNGAQAAKLQWVNENQNGVMSQIACIREQNSNAPGALVFYTSPNVDSNGYTPLERIRIDSSGNVGIGNNSPTHKLSVNGTISGSMPELFQSVSHVTTTTDRSLGGASGWVNHLSTTITIGKYNPVFCSANFAMSYESSDVKGEARFQLVGPSTYTSDALSVAQQSDQNRSRGAHSADWMFGNVTPGSYTVYLQVQNAQGGTWVLNYYLGFDSLHVHYS